MKYGVLSQANACEGNALLRFHRGEWRARRVAPGNALESWEADPPEAALAAVILHSCDWLHAEGSVTQAGRYAYQIWAGIPIDWAEAY